MEGSPCNDKKKKIVLVLIMLVTRESRAKERVKRYDGWKSEIGIPTAYKR